MSNATIEPDLWSMALGGGPLDAASLAAAIEQSAHGDSDSLDFRTRLLIRDSLDALEHHWGRDRLRRWLANAAAAKTLAEISRSQDNVPPGFPSIRNRIVDSTKEEIVLQFLRELGLRCAQPARLEIGGPIALILAGVLSRRTEDIDLVDEVPVALRSQHKILDELANRYALRLIRFLSHFLPLDWKLRLHSMGKFGNLDVWRIDACDVFVGKLFSARIKDRDDLRAMLPHLSKATIEDRLRRFAGPLLAEPELARMASENWFVLFGQPLPA